MGWVGGVKGNFRIWLYISLIVSGSEKECTGIQCLVDVGGECISRLRIGGSRATQCAYAWCFAMHWRPVRFFATDMLPASYWLNACNLLLERAVYVS